MIKLEELLEIVKFEYKEAVIEDTFIINEDKNYQIYDVGDGFFEVYYNSSLLKTNNIIELKNYLDIDITWEDIKADIGEEVKKYERLKIAICTHYISIFDNNNEKISYEKNGNIEVSINYLDEDKNNLSCHRTLFKNLSMLELHKQIILKIKNIQDNEE